MFCELCLHSLVTLPFFPHYPNSWLMKISTQHLWIRKVGLLPSLFLWWLKEHLLVVTMYSRAQISNCTYWLKLIFRGSPDHSGWGLVTLWFGNLGRISTGRNWERTVYPLWHCFSSLIPSFQHVELLLCSFLSFHSIKWLGESHDSPDQNFKYVCLGSDELTNVVAIQHKGK